MARSEICPECGGRSDTGEHDCSTVTRTIDEPLLPPSRPGDVLADRYLLEEQIGAGGSGVVFRARDRLLEIDVALKVLGATGAGGEIAERIRREIRITREIDHANVARVFDLGQSGGIVFFTMRFVDGESLDRLVERVGPLSAQRLDRLAAGLVAALAATHRSGFIHRDVKPANVLVSRAGEAVLVDFGVASEIAPPAERARRLTPPGFVIGTPGYLSPERLAGHLPGPSADLWALAQTLAFAASGALRKAADAAEVLHAVAEPLRSLLVRALAQDPRDRPRDATVLADALRESRHGTTFVGRTEELASLDRAIEESALVTLVGPPGTGKTRLVHEYLSRASGPSFFCDLVEASDVDDVCSSVARALDVPLRTDPIPQIGAALAARGRALVVLDNFEQLVGRAEPLVRTWAEASPQTRFLVTSREALGIPAERVLELGPLSLPDAGGSIGRSDAADLFVARARLAQPGWTATQVDEATVAELVRELDGLPLAIELAAARMRLLAPRQILENLRRRFDLLAPPPGQPRGRRASLAGAVDWSWELLDESEREVFAQCAVFRGGFDVAAAEAVVDPGPGARPLLDLLESLHGKSLLTASDSPGGRRLGMLVTIREYAARKLADAASASAVEARHAAHYLGLAGGWRESAEGPDAAATVRALRLESENLLAIHRRALARRPGTVDDAIQAIDATLALEPLFAATGPFAATLSLLDAAAAAPGAVALPAASRARAKLARGDVLRPLGRLQESLAELEAARALAVEAGDRALSGRVDASMAATLLLARNLADARPRVERALEALREVGDGLQEAVALGVLGQLCQFEGRLDEAHAHLEEACRIHRALGHVRWEGRQTYRLAVLLHERGRLEEARTRYERALEIHRGAGDRWLECVGSANFAILAQEQGAMDEARRLHETALAIGREIGNRWNEPGMVAYFGRCALVEGRLDEAEARFDEALRLARAVADARNEGLVLSWLGCVHAMRDRADRAAAALDRADERLAGADEGYRVAAAMHRGLLDLALAREARAKGDSKAAERLRGAALARLDAGGPVSADVRLARVLLARAIASEKPASTDDALLVGEGGRWFRLPGGKRVRLDRRRALPGILTALARCRERSPGTAVALSEIVEAGWPGEKMGTESAQSRVYMAIATLRKLGLGDLLRTAGDGYLLDPEVPLVRDPSE